MSDRNLKWERRDRKKYNRRKMRVVGAGNRLLWRLSLKAGDAR